MRFGSYRVNCAPGIVNNIEEKGKKFLKHSMLNETLLWMLVWMAIKTSMKLNNNNYLSMQANHNEAWYELIKFHPVWM